MAFNSCFSLSQHKPRDTQQLPAQHGRGAVRTIPSRLSAAAPLRRRLGSAALPGAASRGAQSCDGPPALIPAGRRAQRSAAGAGRAQQGTAQHSRAQRSRARPGRGRSVSHLPPPRGISLRRPRAGRRAAPGKLVAEARAPLPPRSAPLLAHHGQQTAAAGAAARVQPRRSGRGVRLRAQQLRRHPRPAARLPAAPAVPVPGRRGCRRLCCSSTDITAELFEHIHHHPAARCHHICSSRWRLPCLQGRRVGGHLHLPGRSVCHRVLSNWDPVLSRTEAAKMPQLRGGFWLSGMNVDVLWKLQLLAYSF